MTGPEEPDQTENPRRKIPLIWLGIGCLLATFLVSIPFLRRDESTSSTDARPIAVLPEGFASSNSCKECHPHQHRSWHASYHRTMTQLVSPETAPSAIDGASVIIEGEQYRFEQEGEQFFVTFHDPVAGGELRRREIVMMTGSHHMHVFWYDSDVKRTPGLLPIVYLKDEQRWIPRRAAFLRPPDMPDVTEIGRWNNTCSNCHSTHPRQRLDEDTSQWDTHVVEFGIACEACHGQGAQHVQRHSSKSGSSADDKIVNPLTISRKASSDICGRCHSIATSHNMDASSREEFFQNGHPFQPGQLLSEIPLIRIVQASAEHRDTDFFRRWSQNEDMSGSFWPDGMPRVSGREYNGLIESPCYQHGDMTCLSCHTMHPDEGQPLDAWRDDQLKPNMRGDQACLQCHADYAQRIPQHTHHQEGSSGSRCLNCHMPYTTYGLLKTIRSHQISSPSVMTSVHTGRPSACTLCHLDRSFQWISNHLHDWYGQPQLDLDEETAGTSAAVMHFLRGDAGQRAIQASAFGWQPAREVSGSKWMEPFLLFGMNDPYDAVRIISARSIKTLPGRESPVIDVLADQHLRDAAVAAAMSNIDQKMRFEPRPELLIDEHGAFDFSRAYELIQKRSHRRVNLQE